MGWVKGYTEIHGESTERHRETTPGIGYFFPCGRIRTNSVNL